MLHRPGEGNPSHSLDPVRAALLRNSVEHLEQMHYDFPFFHVKNSLCPDVADALEQFKLAIVRHRATGFVDASQEELLQVLNCLRHYVLFEPRVQGAKQPCGVFLDADGNRMQLNQERD